MNQQDIPERNSQVPRMRDIYRTAVRVLVWLGRYHEPSDDLLEVDKHIWGFGKMPQGTQETATRIFSTLMPLAIEVYDNRDAPYECRLPTESLSAVSRVEWIELFRLFRRPWFQRLWVIQEVSVARHAQVLYGHCKMSWPDFSTVCEHIGLKTSSIGLGSNLGNLFMDLMPANSTFVALEERCTLLELLRRYGERLSTDPRDRIYSLLGICNDGEGVTINYEKPYCDVYADWVWRKIQTTGNLDVFSLCVFSETHDCPSWVPDILGTHMSREDTCMFYSTIKEHGSHFGESAGKILYSASGRSVCEPERSECGLEISMSGLHIDSIVKITDEKEILAKHIWLCKTPSGNIQVRVPSENRVLDAIQSLEIEIAEHFGLKELCYGSDKWTEFVDVLFRGSKRWYGMGVQKFPEQGLQDRYATWRGYARVHPLYEPSTAEDLRLKRYLAPLHSKILSSIANIRIFVTASGRIGTITDYCDPKVNDKIYVLFGGHTPYLLRNIGDNYRLLAPCYVHGLMDGEAIAGWRIGKYKTEKVTLE